MKKIFTVIGSLLIVMGLKAQKVQVKKETSKAPVHQSDNKRMVTSQTNSKAYKINKETQKTMLKTENKAMLKTESKGANK